MSSEWSIESLPPSVRREHIRLQRIPRREASVWHRLWLWLNGESVADYHERELKWQMREAEIEQQFEELHQLIQAAQLPSRSTDDLESWYRRHHG